MIWLALVCSCFLLSSVDSKHIAVELVTCSETPDDDVTLVQTADLSQNAADGIVERGPMEVRQPDSVEFRGDREYNEAKMGVKYKSKKEMEAATEAKMNVEMKGRFRYKEKMETGTRAEIKAKAESELEEEGKAERKTGIEEEVEIRSKLRAEKDETKEKVMKGLKTKSGPKIQTQLKPIAELELLHRKHTLKLGGKRKSEEVKTEVKSQPEMQIKLGTKEKAKVVVTAGSKMVAKAGTRTDYQMEKVAKITAKSKRKAELETETVAAVDVNAKLKPGAETDKDTEMKLEETMRSDAKIEKNGQTEGETKVKIRSSWETANEAESTVNNDAKSKLEANVRAETNSEKREKKKGFKLKVKKEDETKKEVEKKPRSKLNARMEVRSRLKADSKVKVNVTMDLKSKVEIEIEPVPVLKTRGFPQSLTNAFKRTTSSLPRPGGLLDLGIRTVQPFVEWTKTMCKSLPVDYNFLVSTYRRLTSRRGGGEVRDVRFKNGKTQSPDLGLKTLVKDLEISSGVHEDESEIFADLKVIDAKTPPPSPPKSKENNGRNGNVIKNGSRVGLSRSPPPSPPKPSWHDLPLKSTGQQEDMASDSDEETPKIPSKGVSDHQGQEARGRAPPSKVKSRKSPPRGDTEIDRHTLQEPSKWAKGGSKDHRSNGEGGKPDSGPTLEERVKAQEAEFMRMASIEQSIRAMKPKKMEDTNGNAKQNRIGKVNGVKNGNGAGVPKTPPPSPPKPRPPSPPKTPPPSPPKSQKKSPKQSPKNSPPKEGKGANGGALDDRSSLPKSTSLFPRLGSWRNIPSTSRGKEEDTDLAPNFEEAPKKPSKEVGYRQGQGARSKASSSTVKRNWYDLSPMPSGEQVDATSGSDSDVDEAPKKPPSGEGYRQGQGARGKATSSTVKGKKPSPWDSTYIEGYTLQELPMWAKEESKDLQSARGQEGKPESGLTLEERIKKQGAEFERAASIQRTASAQIPMPSSKFYKEQFRDPSAWRKLDDKYGSQKN